MIQVGQEVLALTGVHITRRPDTIRVNVPIPELQLRAGDVIFRYMYHGEGFADIWANGSWHKDYDCTFVAEKEEGGCLRDCAAKVELYGEKEWWVNIKMANGKTGWVLVDENFDGMDSLA